jgi:hypothetical protein
VTDSEWLASTDPIKMLNFLGANGKASDRKLRLFAVACSRRVWDFLDDLGRGAVEMAELFADGLASPEELRGARLACKSAGGRAVWYAAASDPLIAARNTVLSIQSGLEVERIAQASLLRDIVGNPFRSLAPDRCRVNPAVVDLASLIYAGRGFDCIGDVADALEEAGCTSEEILGHLRGPGPHCRGCWLLDLLLGKS